MRRELVERGQSGDRDAYEALARDVAPRLFLVASRILRDADAADDAVQQALVLIWRDLRTLRDADRFDAWAYRIVVNACRTEFRRARRVEAAAVSLWREAGSARDEIGSVAIRDELSRAFALLSHDHRAVIVLHHLVGLPLIEIAEILDLPYGTIGSRHHHALRSLRASLEAFDRAALQGGQPA